MNSAEVLINIPGAVRGFADPWMLEDAKHLKPVSRQMTVETIDGQQLKRRMVATVHGWLCLTTGSVFGRDGLCKTSGQVWIDSKSLPTSTSG